MQGDITCGGVIIVLANSLGLNITRLNLLGGNRLVNIHVIHSVGMVDSRFGRYYIRIPGVGHLLPTRMPKCFSIKKGILHYVAQEEHEAFDHEAPELEEVDEEKLAPEQEVLPQDDIEGETPYATYTDAYNLEDSINNMNDLANSL